MHPWHKYNAYVTQVQCYVQDEHSRLHGQTHTRSIFQYNSVITWLVYMKYQTNISRFGPTLPHLEMTHFACVFSPFFWNLGTPPWYLLSCLTHHPCRILPSSTGPAHTDYSKSYQHYPHSWSATRLRMSEPGEAFPRTSSSSRSCCSCASCWVPGPRPDWWRPSCFC